jgi:hypothetical protein
LQVYRQYENRLTVGDPVVLVGLEDNTDLNGKSGHVSALQAPGGRIAVVMESGLNVNVHLKNIHRPLHQDCLHCLVVLESPDGRWKQGLAELRSKVFPGKYTQEFVAFDGLRLVLQTVDRIVQTENQEQGPALWDAARILHEWAALPGGYFSPIFANLVELLAPDQEEKSILETGLTWILNDGVSWDKAKELPAEPQTDEAAATAASNVARTEEPQRQLVALLQKLEPHRRDPRIIAPALSLILRCETCAVERVAVAAISILADVTVQGGDAALERLHSQSNAGDVAFFGRTLRLIRPLVLRVDEQTRNQNEVEEAAAFGKFMNDMRVRQIKAQKEQQVGAAVLAAQQQAALQNRQQQQVDVSGAGVFDDDEVPDNRRTRPFTAETTGLKIPLVGAARKDCFGKLALVSLFSDHEGRAALDPIAAARGETEILGKVFAPLSQPVTDAKLRATLDANDIAFSGTPQVRAAMEASGAAAFTGKEVPSKNGLMLPVLRINFGTPLI